MVVAVQVRRGENPVHVAVIVIERQRDLQLRGHLLEGRLAIGAPAIDPHLAQYACLPSVNMSIVRVEREGAVKQALRFSVVLPRRAVVQHLGGEHALISRHERCQDRAIRATRRKGCAVISIVESGHLAAD